jgi:glycerol-3-phosphate dehydrogenase
MSKGIHIVTRRSDVPVRQPLVIQSRHQRRILFVVPWGQRTYLGTTDAPYEGDPGLSGVTAEDEEELLGLVARVLPTASLSRNRIVSAWSGVRPLVREGSGRGAADTVELSRSHKIVEGEHGVLGIVGGKLTTYRSMAEEVVDLVCERLLRAWPGDRAQPSACTTHLVPVIPGDTLSDRELAEPLRADLARRHGTRRALRVRAEAEPASARLLIDDLPFRWVEIEHALAHEGCTHLDDILRRRLPIALKDTRLGAGVARRVGELLVDRTGGSEADVRDELDRYREAVARETGRTVELG